MKLRQFYVKQIENALKIDGFNGKISENYVIMRAFVRGHTSQRSF